MLAAQKSYKEAESANTHSCIVLNNIITLTKTIDADIRPAVVEYLENFKTFTERNVLEKNISVLISKNNFVSGIL